MYRGIHSSRFGCFHVPAAAERGRDMPAYEVEELDGGYCDGGLYVGNRVKIRAFSLDCYFDGITLEMREGLLRWLDRNTKGALIYDDKPYVYYEVRPAKRIEIKEYTHREKDVLLYSGTFTATFHCYDPFGKLFAASYDAAGEPGLIASTGILPTSMMPPAPNVNDTMLLAYNCGTERAPLVMRLAGDVGNGLSIVNETTGQTCRITGLKAGEIPAEAYIEIDSGTGQVWLVKGPERNLAFHYHDMGYIQLAPCTPFVRSLRVQYAASSRVVTSDGGFSSEMAGQYLFLNGSWTEIRQVDSESSAQLRNMMTIHGAEDTPVVTMNKISLRGEAVALSRLEIEYTPRIK